MADDLLSRFRNRGNGSGHDQSGQLPMHVTYPPTRYPHPIMSTPAWQKAVNMLGSVRQAPLDMPSSLTIRSHKG